MGEQHEHEVGYQACLYCLEPLSGRVIGLTTDSQAYGSTHFALHLACFQRAFADAAAPFTDADLEDMSVEWRPPAD